MGRLRVTIVAPSGRPLQLRYRDQSGKLVRISTGTHDIDEANRMADRLLGKLALGLRVTSVNVDSGMSWDDFRDHYRDRHTSELRKKSLAAAETPLNICEKLVDVETLAQMAERETLLTIRSKLLASKRSRHTCKSTMRILYTALNWAVEEGILASVPKVPKIKTSKLKQMKGRPITGEEFERILAATSKVVGDQAAESWQFLLRGLWASGLRIDEIMSVSWDDHSLIVPEWSDGRFPTLVIPADQQKNDTEESIPLLPWFESVLLEIPESLRTGYVFNPVSLQSRIGRKVKTGRLQTDWVGRVICRIGKAAGVVVDTNKFASAHDLRRGCAQRLMDAGVSPENIMAVMRHASWETTRRHYAPGRVQAQARQIRESLSVTGNVVTPENAKST